MTTIVTTLCCLAAIFVGTNAGSVPLDNPAPRAQTPFTFDDIFSSAYRAKSFSGSWINGTHFLYREESGNVMYYDAVTKAQTVFINNSTFTQANSYTYFVSNDLQYVLFAYNRRALWRHSFNAQYVVYNVATKAWTFLPKDGNANVNATLQYCNWSPSGHSLAFVYGNNLYYQSAPESTPVQFTTSGDPTWVFNAVPDWLYEEDVLSDRVAHYWSPSNDYILYAEFNDTGVPLQDWPWYGDKSNVYPETISIAYPKAGDVAEGDKPGPNTRVKLYVVNTTDGTKKSLSPPTELQNVDHYYLQVEWRDDTNVMVTWANRVQNHSYSIIYDASSTSDPLGGQLNLPLVAYGGWIEVPPATPWFVDNGAAYLTVLPQNITDGNPWRNLARVDSTDGATDKVSFLMKKAEEVEYIVGYNSVTKDVYFVSTNGDPLERHVMRVKADAGVQTPFCMTCGMPDTCRYMSASFSSSGVHYFLNCYGPDVPNYSLRNTENEEDVVVLEDNSELAANLALKLLPTREFFNISVGGGYTGRAEVFRPPGHMPGNNFPMLYYVYAGPGSQRVMKTFPMGGTTSNWLTFLKSSHNIGVVSVDGRGSMAAGDKLKFEMYRKLSTVEIEDQITTGAYMRSLPDVDDTIPSAIFGWSYGGGVAAHVIGDTTTTFTCGISVAPVTTKTYYDTAYTERYLGLATKSDNEAGYVKTDVMNKAANFMNKTFMIAHGTADDNVHFMHMVQLVRALSDTGVQFRQNLYSDQNHGISSPGQSRHLYASMTNFLLNDCWPSKNPVEAAQTSSAVTQLPSGMMSALALFATAFLTLVRRGIA